MEVENGGLEDDFNLQGGFFFYFHDYGTNGIFTSLHVYNLHENPVKLTVH